MSYSEDQEKFRAELGDRVKILCKASDNDPWCNEWTEGMDRFIGHIGVIVDSAENIMSPEGMVRLGEVISYNFTLDGIQVYDDRKRKLGRVENYTLDPEIFDVQQLYLKPTLMQSLSISSLTVNRSQIIDVSNDRIVVKTPTVKDKADNKIISITDQSIPFDNPFRKPKPVSENIDRD
jgi:sporulation protein YlmC with PRC-barrel domain